MRGALIAALHFLALNVVFMSPQAHAQCQANRVQASQFDFSGAPTVTIPVGSYPNSFANALQSATNLWNGDQDCATKDIPEFLVDKNSLPASSTTSDQMKLIFRANDAAPFDLQANSFISARVLHNQGVVEVFGKCPANVGARSFPFCDATRTNIAWGSQLGIVTLAHELGHTLRIHHDTCTNGIMQEAPAANGQILPEHCTLADELHAVVPVTMTVSGISTGSSSQSGAYPETVYVRYDYTLPGTQAVTNDEIAVEENGTLDLPPLHKVGSATFSAYSLNPNKGSCGVNPSNVSTPTGPISVQATCTCQGSGSTDCPYNFPQDQTKFEPFLPLWQIFSNPQPWYLTSFGPFTREFNPAECERQTVCTESPQQVVTAGGEIIVMDVLTCTDQCVAASTIDLQGPSTKIEFPGGDHAGTGTLTVDGYAVDRDGVSGLRFYVDEQPVTLSGLQTNLSRPDACTEVQAVNQTNCSTTGGFRGTLNATSLSAGTHKLRVVALDEKTDFPMATLAEKNFTVPSCFDSTRPNVSMSSPADGATVSGTVAVSASATDNVGVTRVDLYVDGVRKSIDSSAPYSYAWNTTTVGNGSHTVQARAFDACGNSRWSTSRTVTVHNITPCQANSTTLCLQNNRFSARVAFGGTQAAAIPFTSSGGFFRLGDPANVEVAVKVLDGRSSNGRFWVFHGSLTSQPYTVTVTDTHTGRVRSYSNSGMCGGADTGSFIDSLPLWHDLAISSGTCTPSSTAVCLTGDRFQVEVLRSGNPQRGAEVTSKTGSFGFGTASAPEVVVKVLDGRAVNNRFWVFYGSLTNQSYQVRVTDAVTGISRTYNSAGFCGNADVSAF